MRRIFLVGVVVLFAGCTTARTARLFDLDTGESLHARMALFGQGHGKAMVEMPDGKTLIGEYSTYSGEEFSTVTNHVGGNFTGNLDWASVQRSSVTRSNVTMGRGVVTGDGIVLEAIFHVDPSTGRGNGVGHDNKGHKYRLEF
jgi:hypothetical protein